MLRQVCSELSQYFQNDKENNMKKTLLVSALMSLFLAACGDSDNAGNQTEQKASGTEPASAEQQAAPSASSNLNIYNWSD